MCFKVMNVFYYFLILINGKSVFFKLKKFHSNKKNFNYLNLGSVTKNLFRQLYQISLYIQTCATSMSDHWTKKTRYRRFTSPRFYPVSPSCLLMLTTFHSLFATSFILFAVVDEQNNNFAPLRFFPVNISQN